MKSPKHWKEPISLYYRRAWAAARNGRPLAIVAEIAKEIGCLTVGVVTRPFTFEGRRRTNQADEGVGGLQSRVDTLIIIPNNQLLQVIPADTPLQEAFRVADDVLDRGTGISSGYDDYPRSGECGFRRCAGSDGRCGFGPNGHSASVWGKSVNKGAIAAISPSNT
jgi:cell division protein FtsZ